MEDKAPSIAAFAEVQKGFEKAVDLLQKEDEESKGKIASLVKKVEQESTKRNACELKLKEKENEADKLQQTIADMKISEKNKIQILKNELDKRRILIEELSDQNNSKDLDDLKAKADEKNKMIRSLKKRVKIFDKVLTKKQKEQEDFIKKEKEMQLMLRKKLKALKNGTQSVANDEELKLVKKKYNEEVRLMRKEIEDYEARVQKMNSERFEWESEKQKCEEDLKVLLKDHAQKGDLLTACQAKVEKFKERERKHHQNFDALKNLYERLEQKYKDTFNKERPEYVGMIRRVESLELENQRLRKSLSQKSKTSKNGSMKLGLAFVSKF
ncbi:dynein regulatory complex protein 1-like [Clytia hemisphaerica]|uniref:dynein regulatory complex protein 1-like n=1 Tax=Clytia hemisphaerica TaxID=252671 RepID=UPI0034D47B17